MPAPWMTCLAQIVTVRELEGNNSQHDRISATIDLHLNVASGRNSFSSWPRSIYNTGLTWRDTSGNQFIIAMTISSTTACTIGCPQLHLRHVQ
jgi:hypothetical protein